MNILFVHQNFPAQFKHLAPELARQGHEVVALTRKRKTDALSPWNGVTLKPYSTPHRPTSGVHPWLVDLATKVIRGEACFRAARQLQLEGFRPDAIIAHPGWGESLFLKDVWPESRLGIYCEFFYRSKGSDSDFDPEFPLSSDADACRIRLKNANHLLDLEAADAGISPTHWQASTFPTAFREKISVVHDGIDTERLAPDKAATLVLHAADGHRLTLSREDEVITFANRNLEPYRGYHIFMRALPMLLRERPRAQVLIVGGDGMSYGVRPDPALHGESSWKQIFLDEVRGQISDADWARVHFVGQLSYERFVTLLQISSVHVYLTYPFVLGWSLLEAMSVGCAVVASDTPPLHEAIRHGETGLLVDFFDTGALVQAVCRLLDDPDIRGRLGEQARVFARTAYDLKTVCLPKQLDWVESLLF